LHIPFAYVTIAQARYAGIPATGDFSIDDPSLSALIGAMSHWINRLTDQWFMPVRLVHRADGADGSIVRLPNQVPILDFFALRMGREDLAVVEMPAVAYQVKPRYVMMVSRNTRLPDYPLYMIMDGVFGWLVDDFAPVRTITTAQIDVGDTSIPVSSISGLNVNDTLLVGRDPFPKSGSVIITGFLNAPTRVSCEAVNFSCPSGSPAVRYGRVPDLIQRACLLMVRDRWQKIGDIDTAQSPFGIGTRLNSESVEGYSYGMSPMPATNGHAGGSWTTGNVEVDDILQQFSTPAMYIGLA